MEGTTNRVSLQRLDAVLANVASKLSKKEQEKFNNSFTIKQKDLLRIRNGIATRPGIYYNFICREINPDVAKYYEKNRTSMTGFKFKPNVNPNGNPNVSRNS
mgnify:CR=1 FL=1